MDKMREEFEVWYRNHMRDDEDERVEVIDSTIESYNANRGKYGYSDIQELWLSWKASRASLCVELPIQYQAPLVDEPAMDADEVRWALEESGVSYK